MGLIGGLERIDDEEHTIWVDASMEGLRGEMGLSGDRRLKEGLGG
jgi:hypothetical protein